MRLLYVIYVSWVTPNTKLMEICLLYLTLHKDCSHTRLIGVHLLYVIYINRVTLNTKSMETCSLYLTYTRLLTTPDSITSTSDSLNGLSSPDPVSINALVSQFRQVGGACEGFSGIP